MGGKVRVVLSGVETNNKGAELMLYAILKELERRYAEAEVFMPVGSVLQGFSYIGTSLRLRNKPFVRLKIFAMRHRVDKALRRLGIPGRLLSDTHTIDNADYFLDASGFAFSDQFHNTVNSVLLWEELLSGYRRQGTRVVFLPQAFGPFEKPISQRLVQVVLRNSDLVFARDRQSLAHVLGVDGSCCDVRLAPDFTSLVEGVIPAEYAHLRNAVCVIPNSQMINKGVLDYERYVGILSTLVQASQSMGKRVYMLNHEGRRDEALMDRMRSALPPDVLLLSGLNALEVKGLISTSYLCISSRFHGVASALNCCVPCLATSWSHKYQELFADYGQTDCVLSLNNDGEMRARVLKLLDADVNAGVRQDLSVIVPSLQEQARKMWDLVFTR